MNGMVLYFGRSGHTRQSAAWLSQHTGFELVNLAMRPRLDFSQVNPVILGSSVRDGRLLAADWLAEHWPELRSKKVVLYTVSGLDPEALEQVLRDSLSPEMRLRIRLFSLSLPGRSMRKGALARLSRWLKQALKPPAQSPTPACAEAFAPLLAHIRELTRLQSRVSALHGRTRKRAPRRLAPV